MMNDDIIDAGLGEKGGLNIPISVWNASVPSRLLWNIRQWSSNSYTGRYGVWELSVNTKRMIGELVDTRFLCKDVGCLKGTEFEVLRDNVFAFMKPKNDVKCSFIIDMHNLNDRSKVKLHKVGLPSVQPPCPPTPSDIIQIMQFVALEIFLKELMRLHS